MISYRSKCKTIANYYKIKIVYSIQERGRANLTHRCSIWGLSLNFPSVTAHRPRSAPTSPARDSRKPTTTNQCRSRSLARDCSASTLVTERKRMYDPEVSLKDRGH